MFRGLVFWGDLFLVFIARGLRMQALKKAEIYLKLLDDAVLEGSKEGGDSRVCFDT